MTTTTAERRRELLSAMTEVVNRSNARLKATQERLGVTIPQSEALWVLDPDQPPPSMKDLAAGLYCDPSTATFIVDRLVSQGLAERTPGVTDRRSKTVSLTERGRTVRAELVTAMVESSLLTTLSDTDQAAALRLLRRALAKDRASAATA